MKLGNLIDFIDFLHHFLESHVFFREIDIRNKVGLEFLQLLQCLLVKLSVFTLARCQQLDRLGAARLSGWGASVLQQLHLQLELADAPLMLGCLPLVFADELLAFLQLPLQIGYPRLQLLLLLAAGHEGNFDALVLCCVLIIVEILLMTRLEPPRQILELIEDIMNLIVLFLLEGRRLNIPLHVSVL